MKTKKVLLLISFLILIIFIFYLSVENYQLNQVYQQGFTNAVQHWQKGCQQLLALQEALDNCQDGYSEKYAAEAKTRARLCDWEWQQLGQYCMTGPGQYYRNGEKKVTYHGQTASAAGNGYGESQLYFLFQEICLRLDHWREKAGEPGGEAAYQQFVLQAKKEIDLLCEAVHDDKKHAVETPEQLYQRYIVTMAGMKEIVEASSLLQAAGL